MSNLTAIFPLDGFKQVVDGLLIEEITGLEIVSIAIAQGEDDAANKAFKKAFRATLPKPGEWTEAKTGKVLWTGQSQYFMIQNTVNENAGVETSEAIGSGVYTTLQTDGWATLNISGDRVYDVLERFIPLDLKSPKPGFGTRTQAHHMAVIVMKTGVDAFTLMTPRSSCQSFLHALTAVAENLIPS